MYPKPPTNPLPASRAGTRSVNRLSAAQLARKRANDREAQRAIRQRTKDQIDFLERRVEQLKDPEKERRTWILHMRNRQLEEEVATLRDRINALETRNTGAMDAGAPLSEPTAGLDCDMRPDGLPMWWRTLDIGFPGAGIVLPRADTPATYALSNGLISPFPPDKFPATSFTNTDPASWTDFSGSGGGGDGDDLAIRSDPALRQYFPRT